MEADMLHAAGSALLIILDPHRLIYLFAGVCMGLGLGLLPGIGGIAGTALMLPFTYALDPHAAFALLLGLGATTTTADPISAILFGVRAMPHRRQPPSTDIRSPARARPAARSAPPTCRPSWAACSARP